jgi:hypothetical protein
MRTLLKPSFTTAVIDADPRDGYWVQAVDIDGDGRVDLVASGLTRGEVVWYQNPGWRRRIITTMDKPVSLDVADLTGDGRPDLVICHDYGNCMFDCGPQDGRISWLRNPTATDLNGLWEHRPIAELVATHRIRLGQFTSSENVQLAALPVVGAGTGAASLAAPVRTMVYDQPADPLSEDGWPGTELDTSAFRVVHGVVAGRFPGTPDPDRDSFLLASAEGISWLGTDEDGAWQHTNIGTGVAPQPSREFPAYQFAGSGNLAIGTVGGVSHALILAVEPFHGNTLALYLRPPGQLTFARPWARHEVEVFPAPDAEHDAVAHHVVAADFDGDGDDEFLVAVRGPAPTQGVYYYKFDATGRLLLREQVSTGSVARIAVADFHGDGRLDFVTTAYDTVGYYEIDDPRIELHRNTFAPPAPVSAPPGGDG